MEDCMSTAVIQRQFDHVIATHYDLDPQSVISNSLDRLLQHLQSEAVLGAGLPPLAVLDIGMGTGLFYEKLLAVSDRDLLPFGLDISRAMVEIARRRIPGLVAEVADGANVDQHFCDERFDLVCTHFVTGFVPLEHLAPRIWDKLKPGGYWSFAGAISGAFPELQRKANSRLIRWLFGGRKLDLSNLLTPEDEAHVTSGLRRAGFDVEHSETFRPELRFTDYDDFMEFAYRGGWLTPFIEDLGLHKLKPPMKALLDRFAFPVSDNHCIGMALARKPLEP